MARRAGTDLVTRDFYSPVPDVEVLPDELWERPSGLRGIDFRPDAYLGFLEQVLAPYVAEFNPPSASTGREGEFYLDNGYYGRVDAEILYAMVRRYRPKRILELGAGFSSLVIDAALERNPRDESRFTEHRIFDPFPRAELSAGLGRDSALFATPATEVPLQEFEALERDDILFVDTTHTVKTGGDVSFIVLDALPLLQPGVVVHFHDIFLPWEYPRSWLDELRRYWAEQYLLQAFLAFNHEFEILLPNHALTRAFPRELQTVIPSSATPGPEHIPPAGFWFRRA